MTPSAKLGITSALLLGITIVPPYSNWRAPVNFACYGMSFVLGVMAERLGNRWWLAILCTILAECAFAAYIAAHSY